MYAIIADSGRQYKVTEGQLVDVDYRGGDPGEELKFERVLMVGSGDQLKLGVPTVEGAEVTAQVIGTEMGKKLTVQKFRRRKNSRRKTGHRQMYTRVKINSIQAPGIARPETPAAEAAPQETPSEAAAEPAQASESGAE